MTGWSGDGVGAGVAVLVAVVSGLLSESPHPGRQRTTSRASVGAMRRSPEKVGDEVIRWLLERGGNTHTVGVARHVLSLLALDSWA